MDNTRPAAPRSVMEGNAGNVPPPPPRNEHGTVINSASTVSEFKISILDEWCIVTRRQPHGS
ncbi:hypothetical protein FRC09_006883, partial [Ceratobasidium sp. 395]